MRELVEAVLAFVVGSVLSPSLSVDAGVGSEAAEHLDGRTRDRNGVYFALVRRNHPVILLATDPTSSRKPNTRTPNSPANTRSIVRTAVVMALGLAAGYDAGRDPSWDALWLHVSAPERRRPQLQSSGADHARWRSCRASSPTCAGRLSTRERRSPGAPPGRGRPRGPVSALAQARV
jgi:hypothetical protein